MTQAKGTKLTAIPATVYRHKAPDWARYVVISPGAGAWSSFPHEGFAKPGHYSVLLDPMSTDRAVYTEANDGAGITWLATRPVAVDEVGTTLMRTVDDSDFGVVIAEGGWVQDSDDATLYSMTLNANRVSPTLVIPSGFQPKWKGNVREVFMEITTLDTGSGTRRPLMEVVAESQVALGTTEGSNYNNTYGGAEPPMVYGGNADGLVVVPGTFYGSAPDVAKVRRSVGFSLTPAQSRLFVENDWQMIPQVTLVAFPGTGAPITGQTKIEFVLRAYG